MCKPKAPKTPDPMKVADAQKEANLDTARTQTELNRYNEVNPFGSQTWSQDPNNPDKYTLSQQYDPRIMGSIGGSMDLANSNIQQQLDKNRFAGELGNRNADILRQQPGQVPGVDQARDFINIANERLTDPTRNVESSQGVALSGDQALQNALGRVNKIGGQEFNFNQAPAMPTSDEATRQNVSNAIYGRAASRLDPRFQQTEGDLEARLAAQGITQGSDAYQREIDNMARAKNDAYLSAQQEAEAGSADAMNKIFANQLAARQQGVGETQAIRDQTGKEALIASELSGRATGNLGSNLQSQVNRGLAIPQIAGGLMNTMTQGYENEQNQRLQALNEYNALTGNNAGNVNPLANIPGFGAGMGGAGTVGQTPIADSTYASYQGQLDKYGNKMGAYNNLISGVASLGSSAIGGFGKSGKK